ncbi:hypothetical protein ROZALSC1DRAFT_30222 [Rozella allomycis CSF55]|uniref:Ion transport domain-containing protein n=1 Tax=Rozella allomycis (strain CSF55) TaxID=988480 RepID=A0A075B148_ROZAC|nr:Ion transport domain-containing protein [Rozella allomycis CSF55]RKP18035.1 hypothetical protein ROZALSC1DRAFT_30222 [Rozella allomycis CSF55]|eukprot:EPZ36251.1 Ion transport domain-containing protein [Rozella allomycis CSF55]
MPLSGQQSLVSTTNGSDIPLKANSKFETEEEEVAPHAFKLPKVNVSEETYDSIINGFDNAVRRTLILPVDEQPVGNVTGSYVSSIVKGYEKIRGKIFNQAQKILFLKNEGQFLNFLNIVDIDDNTFKSQITRDLAGRLISDDGGNISECGISGPPSGPYVVSQQSECHPNLGECFSGNIYNGSPFQALSSGRILRLFRVFRAFRALRSMDAFKGMQSLPDMANIVFLLLIVMFIYAVTGVTLFGDDLPYYFKDLGTAFYSLFVCITQDGWINIFNALEDKGQFTAAAIYFCSFIIIGAFIFANLVVAVVVTNMENAYKYLKKQELQKKRKLKTRVENVSKKVAKETRNVSEVNQKIYEEQIPFEVPTFEKISGHKLERYFTLLSIVEENMNEYQTLKEQLEGILDELKDVIENNDEEGILEDSDFDLSEDPMTERDIVSEMIMTMQK